MRVSVYHSVRGFSHINSLYAGSSIENHAQMHYELNTLPLGSCILTFSHTTSYTYISQLFYINYHVKVISTLKQDPYLPHIL
jgi:hypothetical protein